MYRLDTDGNRAYSDEDILNGEIVRMTEYNGYWND